MRKLFESDVKNTTNSILSGLKESARTNTDILLDMVASVDDYKQMESLTKELISLNEDGLISGMRDINMDDVEIPQSDIEYISDEFTSRFIERPFEKMQDEGTIDDDVDINDLYQAINDTGEINIYIYR